MQRFSLESTINKVAKAKPKRIVLVKGAFDILHVNHVKFLLKAKSLGDYLIVGIARDEVVKNLKGNHRPIVKELDRAYMVRHLKPVDDVFIAQFPVASDRTLKILKPSVLVFTVEKGKTIRRKRLAKFLRQRFPKTNTVFVKKFPRRISTSIIEKIIIDNHAKNK